MSAVPKGSLVLVSGANGFIASHIIDQLLQAGFNVRGTVREASKADWVKDYVNEHYGSNRFEAAVVPDMIAEGAFDEAAKGASAFIHAAADLSFSSDANTVITNTLAGVNGALAAAAKQPGLTHFVYTSSSAAVAMPAPNTPRTITADMWNDESIRIAWDPAEKDNPMLGAHVYSASKAAGEKAVFDFAATNKTLVVNSVVPNMNWGPLLSPGRQRPSSGGIIPGLYEKGLEGTGMFRHFPPQYHIDVRDDARLHVAPLLDASIKGERLFAYNEVYDWERVLKILHDLRPNWKNEDVYKEQLKNLDVIEPTRRSEEILKKLFGREGFTSMKESIEANIQHLQ